MKFTVIIPVYNVEWYLTRCLESVVQQKIQDLEVIIVDDGSLDRSGWICMKYAEKYSNVKYFRQRNAGLGAARNAGLKQAQGEYVIFLDSDDYWSEDCVLHIQECLAEVSCLDIVYFDAEVIYESEKILRNDEYDSKTYYRKGKIREEICTGAEFYRETYPKHFNVSACMAAYRRAFLLEYGIWFPENVLYEDYLFSLQSILKAHTVKYLPLNLYFRRYREGSIMTSRKGQQCVRSMTEVFMLVADYVESERGKYEEIVFRKMRDLVFTLAHMCLQEFYNNAGYEAEIHKIKIDVCWKMYALLRENNDLWLEEWVSLILLVLYLQDDIDMRPFIDQMLLKEKFDSVDEMLFRSKCCYRRKVGEKLRQVFQPKKYKKIGIYGRGNHTKQLIRMLKREGWIPAELFVIDSNIEESGQLFEGFPVLNIREVALNTELVVLSSFLYEREMYENAIKYLPKQICIKTIYQDEVREICWEWVNNV